jgi:hypothetical protein
MTSNNLAPRDIRRYEQYNKILQACVGKAHSVYTLNALLNTSVPNVRNYALDLVAQGFLSVEITNGRSGANSLRQVSYYTTLRDHYPLEMIQPCFRRTRSEMAAVKGELSSTPGHRLISFETNRNLQAKFSATSKMTREQRVAKKSYVSGSTLSSAL